MHDDAMSAPARGEADVGVAAKRAFDVCRVDAERPAVRIGPAAPSRQAHLAGTLEARRVGADPYVLAFGHTICNCLPSRRSSGVETRRTTTSCPAAQTMKPTSVSVGSRPRT